MKKENQLFDTSMIKCPYKKGFKNTIFTIFYQFTESTLKVRYRPENY